MTCCAFIRLTRVSVCEMMRKRQPLDAADAHLNSHIHYYAEVPKIYTGDAELLQADSKRASSLWTMGDDALSMQEQEPPQIQKVRWPRN